VAAVLKAFDEYPNKKINKMFLMLQSVYMQILLSEGRNKFCIHHLGKDKLARQGQLPLQLKVSEEAKMIAREIMNKDIPDVKHESLIVDQNRSKAPGGNDLWNEAAWDSDVDSSDDSGYRSSIGDDISGDDISVISDLSDEPTIDVGYSKDRDGNECQEILDYESGTSKSSYPNTKELMDKYENDSDDSEYDGDDEETASTGDGNEFIGEVCFPE